MSFDSEQHGPTIPATPLTETREQVPASVVRAIWDEGVWMRCGFVNWLPMLLAIAFGRVRGRPPELRMVTKDGMCLQTPLGDRSWWTAVEVFGRDSYRLRDLDLPAAPTVVDVGANIGAFSLATLALRPAARISAYEASPTAAAMLRKNVNSNKANGRIGVRHCAITGSQERSTVWLSEPDGDLCTSSFVPEVESGPAAVRRIEVPALSLDAILSSHPGDVDLLKIDVEGAEYEIIGGTSVDQLRRIRQVVLEYHDVPGRNVGQLADRLALAGLVWERQEHGGRPGHGLGWWRQH